MEITYYWVAGVLVFAVLLILFIFKSRLICAFFATALIVVFLSSGVFIVYEGSQVVITQFGEIIGKPYTKAGLYFKVPFVWKTNYLDKRLISMEETQPGIPTEDGYYISLKAVFLWRIIDGAAFISAIDSMAEMNKMLRNIASGEVRRIASNNKLLAIIRSKDNETQKYMFGSSHISGLKEPEIFTKTSASFWDVGIKEGRSALMDKAKVNMNKYLLKYGVEVSAAMIVGVSFTDAIKSGMVSRMQLERQRDAAQIRSSGQALSAQIHGAMLHDYQKIIAPARKDALLIRGQADAYVTKVTAEAYGKDRSFYNYWRTLQGYDALPSNRRSNFIVSTDLPFLNLMESFKDTWTSSKKKTAKSDSIADSVKSETGAKKKGESK